MVFHFRSLTLTWCKATHLTSAALGIHTERQHQGDFGVPPGSRPAPRPPNTPVGPNLGSREALPEPAYVCSVEKVLNTLIIWFR